MAALSRRWGGREGTRNEIGISLSSSLPLPGYIGWRRLRQSSCWRDTKEPHPGLEQARARSLFLYVHLHHVSKQASKGADMNDPPPKKDEVIPRSVPQRNPDLCSFPWPTRSASLALRPAFVGKHCFGKPSRINASSSCSDALPFLPTKMLWGWERPAEMVKSFGALSERNAKGEFKSNPSKDRNPAPVMGKVYFSCDFNSGQPIED